MMVSYRLVPAKKKGVLSGFMKLVPETVIKPLSAVMGSGALATAKDAMRDEAALCARCAAHLLAAWGLATDGSSFQLLVRVNGGLLGSGSGVGASVAGAACTHWLAASIRAICISSRQQVHC